MLEHLHYIFNNPKLFGHVKSILFGTNLTYLNILTIRCNLRTISYSSNNNLMVLNVEQLTNDKEFDFLDQYFLGQIGRTRFVYCGLSV